MPNSINPVDYSAFQRYLEQASGIVLGDNKHYLVNSRLNRILKDKKLKELGELVKILESGRDRGLQTEVVDAMTTNETSWFRDTHPYRILQEVLLPEISKNRGAPVRIWSAACSTGQEPYSVSMTVQEFLTKNPGSAVDVQIVATDISPAVLEDAKSGYYDAMAVARGLPADARARYFEQDKNHWEERWQVRENIRRRVRFTHGNLLASYSALGRFDIIFCRNVLIYFSSESKVDIIKRMADILNPGGYLFLGASEAITQYSDEFNMVRCNPGVVYQKK